MVERIGLTSLEKQRIKNYEARTGLKYDDQSAAQRYRIRNNPEAGSTQRLLTETEKANIKKFQNEYDTGDAQQKFAIRTGKYKGAAIQKVDDPQRLKSIKNYIKDFKKQNGELPTKNEVRKYFQTTTGKDVEKSLSLLTKKGEINLPSGYGRSSASIVDNDVKKLLSNKSIVKDLKDGKFPTDSAIKKILKIDPTIAETRAIDLANTLIGNRDIRQFKVPKQYKNVAQNYLDTNVGDMFKAKGSRSRSYYERGFTKLLNLPKNISKIREDIVRKVVNVVPELKGNIAVDEIGSITASMRRGSGPYAIFGQILGSDFNIDVKGLGVDKDKSLLEKKLITLSKDDPQRKDLQKNYNEKVKNFEANANKNNPAKKVKGLKLSFQPPSETIKNKKVYNDYKDLFDAHYEKHGYSFEVPADRDSIVDISKKLDNPNFQNTIKNRFSKLVGKGKFGTLIGLGTLAGTGFALAGEETVKPEVPIKYNDELGAFVDPLNDEKVSQANMLDWAANNPMPTAAVASAPLLSKTVRKGTGKLLKGLLSTLGSSAAGLGFAGLTVKDNLEEGKNIVDATVDPLVGVEMLFPEAAKRFGGKGMQNALGRVLSLGRVGAMMTPVGLGITGLGIGKELYNVAQEEQDRINEMRENDPVAYQEYLAEQQELMDVSA